MKYFLAMTSALAISLSIGAANATDYICSYKSVDTGVIQQAEYVYDLASMTYKKLRVDDDGSEIVHHYNLLPDRNRLVLSTTYILNPSGFAVVHLDTIDVNTLDFRAIGLVEGKKNDHLVFEWNGFCVER